MLLGEEIGKKELELEGFGVSKVLHGRQNFIFDQSPIKLCIFYEP